MIGNFQIAGQAFRANFSKGICIAIPLQLNGPQPSHFGASPARSVALEMGGFIGDTRRGGSCNVPVITINPHCNGTHTETVGHIVNEPMPIHDAVPGLPIRCTLVSITPTAPNESSESYRPALATGDSLLTADSLFRKLKGISSAWMEALVIRTLPNSSEKRHARYGESGFPPFFTIEAIDLLITLGVKHLLVDIPSVDKMHDEGMLTVHHRFWNVPEGSHALISETRNERTITEMVFVPDSVPDGSYLLSLQIPAFSTDAAPSRPWLFPVTH